MKFDCMNPQAFFPADWQDATLLGRSLTPQGPAPVLIRKGRAFDMSRIAPTVSALLEILPCDVAGEALGPADHLDFIATPLLAPVDLHCLKASGVTFAVSAMERVIEEMARGDAGKAKAIRDDWRAHAGVDVAAVIPGSEEAARLKEVLIAGGFWSQYLEVAIGPDAEIFTRAPVLSAMGHGAQVGIRSDSTWNNPEPEIVLVMDRRGKVRGAALGNDVNLRDFEGRSALLLGKAKDNNASCAIGPFIRLFDGGFSLDDVRRAEISLTVEGPDNYRLEDISRMDKISRDPLDLVRQAMSEHQYPDGFALFLGTLFAPTQDRDMPGRGFTHKRGDIVTVASPRLGVLCNEVVSSAEAAPWTFGIGELMQNLAGRGLLGGSGAA